MENMDSLHRTVLIVILLNRSSFDDLNALNYTKKDVVDMLEAKYTKKDLISDYGPMSPR